MSSNRKPSGNIHRIREFELEKVNLADEFDILQIVGEGWFGKILLVEHRATDTEMVLKALPKPYVSLRDFYREFHYGLHLGVHKNIVTTYDVAFETAGFYVFSQEYAPLGDLTSNVLETGIGELHTKRVAKQIASALDFMHSKELVHRDVKLDNVLVCRSDFSRVKLCDFGESRKTESLVHRRNEWLPYSPPEVLCIKTDDTYKALPTHDIWQYGIVIFVCLTGCLPWQKAASDDPRYIRYIAWQNSSMVIPIKRTPKLFKLISSRCCKLFRKILEPNQERRPKNLNDVHKFLDDRWLAKGAEKDMLASEPDELCPSMYSFHSNLEEKTKLLSTLAQHGIEVTVDRVAKKNRIREWIQSSVITEEDEDDDSGSTTPSSINQSRAPIPGHISAVRAMEQIAQKKIVTTIKDASNKHIDPRTGIIQMGPSEMGLSNNSSNNVNGGGDDDDNIYNNYDNNNAVKKHHQTINGQKLEHQQYHHHHHHHHHHQPLSNDEHIETPRRHIVPQQPQQPTRQKFKMKNNKLTDTDSHIITPQTNSTNSSYYSSVDKQLNNDKQLDILMKNGQPQPQYYSNNKINNSNNSNNKNINNHNNNNNINKYNNNNYEDINHSSSSVKDVTQIELNNNQFTPLYVATTIQQMTDNLIKNQIMDSGYGSLDKLKFDGIPNTINSNIVNNNKSVSTTLASLSPVLTKRSSIKSSQSDYLSIDSNFAMDPNPFNSDDDLEEYNQRGSTGFVNLIGNGGLTTTPNNSLSHTKMNATMKDTAYDRIKLKKKIK